MLKHEEANFIDQLLRKEESAYRLLVAKNHYSMISLACAIIGDAYADEVVQEAWVSVIRALPSFERRSSLKTWIMRIVSNEAKSRLRKESRKFSLEDWDDGTMDDFDKQRFDSAGMWLSPLRPWHHDTPEELLEEAELLECIKKILDNLPSAQKAVIFLRDIETHTLDEICNILDITESNVRVLLHRARQRLFATVNQYQETGECVVAGK